MDSKIEQIVKLIVVFLLVAALCCGIGYMVWWFGFRSSASDKPDEPTDPAITIPTDIEIDKGGVVF